MVLSRQCSTGTLDYILQRCQLALQNVLSDADNGDVSLKSFEPAVLKQGEEIHNEVRMVKKLMGLSLTPACSSMQISQRRLESEERVGGVMLVLTKYGSLHSS